MGFSGKPNNQLDGEIRETTDGKKWVIAGIPPRSPLKPINTSSSVIETEDQDQFPTTPTAASVRIPRVPPCPAAPKKRKPSSSKCSHGAAGARVFFSPPDLETVFIQRQRAN